MRNPARARRRPSGVICTRRRGCRRRTWRDTCVLPASTLAETETQAATANHPPDAAALAELMLPTPPAISMRRQPSISSATAAAVEELRGELAPRRGALPREVVDARVTVARAAAAALHGDRGHGERSAESTTTRFGDLEQLLRNEATPDRGRRSARRARAVPARAARARPRRARLSSPGAARSRTSSEQTWRPPPAVAPAVRGDRGLECRGVGREHGEHAAAGVALRQRLHHALEALGRRRSRCPRRRGC